MIKICEALRKSQKLKFKSILKVERKIEQFHLIISRCAQHQSLLMKGFTSSTWNGFGVNDRQEDQTKNVDLSILLDLIET